MRRTLRIATAGAVLSAASLFRGGKPVQRPGPLLRRILRGLLQSPRDPPAPAGIRFREPRFCLPDAPPTRPRS